MLYESFAVCGHQCVWWNMRRLDKSSRSSESSYEASRSKEFPDEVEAWLCKTWFTASNAAVTGFEFEYKSACSASRELSSNVRPERSVLSAVTRVDVDQSPKRMDVSPSYSFVEWTDTTACADSCVASDDANIFRG